MLKQHFRPEFLNRIDETIVFHPLSKEQLTQIVDVQLDHLRKRLAVARLEAAASAEDAKKLLAEEGYDPTYGARPLKRVIQQRIENPLAQRILKGEFAEGDTVDISTDAAKHDFIFGKGGTAPHAEPVMAGGSKSRRSS